MALFTASGGVVYHLRARRHREQLWLPFRRAIAEWLAEALPPGDELILVGPSAGHCLPLQHLARFGRLLALEPEPLARLLLARRLKGASLAWETRDQLLRPLLSGEPGLDDLLSRRRGASVLFCNLLGQVPLALPEARQAEFRRAFRRRVLPELGERRWASFHDRWSLDHPAHAPALPDLRFERAPSDRELADGLFGPAGPPVTVLDHGTAELFPAELPRRYFTWQITPHARHVVEAVSG
jgi:hypothetical protein